MRKIKATEARLGVVGGEGREGAGFAESAERVLWREAWSDMMWTGELGELHDV